ncbi:BglG family transcription antiterminator [Luteococcus sp. OSA5]|uniref:BglG family transcription antiterminator n=1 Tax=Luteococcus sp. OSA5 TaxID=3401630 RepID=UPI003B42BF16
MQRPALILQQLETSLSAAPESLARVLGVGNRTLATEVASLNTSLAPAAQVRLINGRYRLRVVNPLQYAERRLEVLEVPENFNDPEHRRAFILADLVTIYTTVTTEILARRMNVGRTTVTADLAQLRRTLEPQGVRIEGRPNVGLQLVGEELAIRMAVLRHCFHVAYGNYPLEPELEAALTRTCRAHGLDEATARETGRWLVVQLDRCDSRHELEELPEGYQEIVGSPAHAFARELAEAVAEVEGIVLPEAEVFYLALPASGRRTTVGSDSLTEDELPSQIRELVDEIFARVQQVLEVDIRPNSLMGEFGSHLHFMINRMRFSLQAEPGNDLHEIRERFPLAHRMAQVAADVVQEHTGLRMDEVELSLAATYFQVFLDDNASRRNRPFRVGIVSQRGPAAASLLRSQMSKALLIDTVYTQVADASRIAAGEFDLVVASPGSELELPMPVIELSEFFDPTELVATLRTMRFDDFGPLPMDEPDGSMLTYLLEDDRVLRLPAGCTHDRAVELLCDHLVALGLVDEQFLQAIATRLAEQEPVLIGDRLAFPHASSAGLRAVTCALGTIDAGEGSDGLDAVFLMAVPEKADYDDRILIRTYEELIALGTDPQLMTRLGAVTDYRSLLAVLDAMRETKQGS